MAEELLISKCRVKTFLQQSRVRVSGDFYKALDESIREQLLRAVKRSKKNGRSTILSQDL